MAKSNSPESDNPYGPPWAKNTANYLVKNGYTPTTRIANPDNVHAAKILDDIDRAPKTNRQELEDQYSQEKPL